MADTSSKRLRDETHDGKNDAVDGLFNKKPKYSSITDHILSLLEDEEDESTEDLSSLMTTLEQELSSPPESTADAGEPSFSPSSSSLSDEEEREKVMRHLLEASDDELGLPLIEAAGNGGEQPLSCDEGSGDGSKGEVTFDICDGLWCQLEDEAANYYDLMHSGLLRWDPSRSPRS